MKRTSIAAAALLLSTTAYAAIPSTEPSGVVVEKDPYAVTATSAVDNADAGGTATLHNAAAGSWSNNDWAAAEPVAYTADDSSLKQPTDDVADAADATAKADAIETAEADTADAVDEADDTDVVAEPTAMDTEATPVEDGATGVGGPYEAANLTPRPAAQNYPACRPGPGDDRCIQLYEPGVREQLAAWTQPTGGFAGADTQVAMGGPYEPADAAAADDAAVQPTAMNGDGTVDTAMGETADDEDLVEV